MGSSHNIAVGRGGDCFVWGDGDAGQLGLGKLENRPQISINNSFPSVSAVSAGSNHTAVLTKTGMVGHFALLVSQSVMRAQFVMLYSF
jgi:alpha-tubulin suppressor-like RCC1 family protein